MIQNVRMIRRIEQINKKIYLPQFVAKHAACIESFSKAYKR